MVNACPAAQQPQILTMAQLCTMLGKTLCKPPHTAACQHFSEGMREHCDAAPHTRARAARAATQHAAARHMRRFARRSTRQLSLSRAHARARSGGRKPARRRNLRARARACATPNLEWRTTATPTPRCSAYSPFFSTTHHAPHEAAAMSSSFLTKREGSSARVACSSGWNARRNSC